MPQQPTNAKTIAGQSAILDHTAGLVLAGGQSTRMGDQNKALCKVDGKSLLLHSTDYLRRNLPASSPLAVSTGRHQYASQFGAKGDLIDLLSDKGTQGPLAGIAAGLNWLKKHQGFDYLAVIPCDTPFLPNGWIRELSNTFVASPRQMAAYTIAHEKNHYAHSLWHISALAAVEQALANGQYAIKHLLHSINANSVDFTDKCEPKSFYNINTHDQLESADQPKPTSI